MNGHNLDLDRVERKTIVYDQRGRVKMETWEFFYPPEKETTKIGYKLKKKP